MRVRKRILRAGVSKIDLVEDIILNEQRRVEILTTFNQLRDTGRIEANSFEDIAWKYKSEVYNVPFSLIFDLKIYSKFNDLLRAFTVVRINNRVAPSTINLEIHYLKRIIIITKGLRNLNEYHLLCITLSTPESSRITRTLKMFIDFTNLSNKHEIATECERYSYGIHKSRELPDFNHVMSYDKCIDHYFSQLAEEESLKYLPVWLWWRLTTVLPMRPSELFLLPYDCIEFNASFGEYWIYITRIKESLKDHPDSDEMGLMEYEKIQIDKGTYQFIKQFQNKLTLLDETNSSEYLLPYALYQKSLKRKSSSTHIRMDLHSFKNQLKRFHDEVIVDLYGQEECSRVRPGDTRHFAIINMFLQGYNPLSIARMAGHDNIITQENYYNHAIHFAESHIYHLAQQKFESRTNQRITSNPFGKVRDAYDRGLQYSYDELKYFREVEFGYCKDLTPEFPDNCTENCLSCMQYIFKPAINEQEEGLKKLTQYSKELGDWITKEIENIFKIGSKINKINTIRVDESLKNKSRSLSQLMEAKVLVDSIRIEADSYE